MAYTIVNGTNGNNTIAFVGITGFYNQTLVNPYSGYTITITGTKNVNNAIYDGLGGNDTLSMTALGDVLTLTDSSGTIMVRNVEFFNAGADGDIIILANATQSYGNTTIRGADGDDILWANNGNDQIIASNGNDIVDGGGGNDRLFGENDDDYLSGGLGIDALLGGGGNDTLIYSADALWTGGLTLANLGSAIPFAASVNLDGTNRTHDSYYGDLDAALMTPSIGVDTLIMTSGDDTLVISDTLSPVDAFFTPRIGTMDIINAGNGNDIVDFSGLAHESITINGGQGQDTLGGSLNNDVLNGEDGDDRLFGAGGNDVLAGGSGDDAYYYNLGNGSDTITETSGTDKIVFGPGITFSSLTLAVSGADLIVGIGSETITIVNHFVSDFSGRVEGLLFDDGSTYDLGSYTAQVDPVAQDDTFSGTEDQILNGSVLGNDTDENNDTLSVQPQTLTTANGGTVVINIDGTFTYQGAVNFNGTDNFSYTLTDGSGGTDTAQVTLNIAPVNDSPVAVTDIFAGSEDTAITGSLLDNDIDVDGDLLSAVAETITSANGGMVTINADGTFSYQGATNFNGSDSFSYTVTDGKGGFDTADVSLTVAAINDTPDTQDDVYSGQEDTPLSGDVLINDSDSDGEGLSVDAQTITTAGGATVSLNSNGTFTYLGALNFNGTDSFTYTARDAAGATSTATVLLAIAAVNDDPVATSDSFAGFMDAVVSGNVLADNGNGVDSDVDGDVLTVQTGTFSTAQGGTVTLNADGTFIYLGADGFYGSDSFDYTVFDGQGAEDTATVTLEINIDPDGAIVGTEDDETITGTNTDDQIFALGGADTVKGMDGNDTLNGGAGDDILYGDDSILTGLTIDKSFADSVVLPDLKERTNISNLNPSAVPALGVAEGNLSVSYDATASITFRKGYAGYNNSLGSFAIAEDGTIVNGTMHWANVKTAGIDVTHQIDLPTGANGGNFGFFIIANGNSVNNGYGALDITGEGHIQFIYNYGKADARAAKVTDGGSKVSIVYNDGSSVKVLKGTAFFTTDRGDAPTLNKDGKVHVVSGLRDTNNLSLDIKKADLATKPVTFTKNGISLTALTGTLVAPGDKVGIKSSQTGGDIISGTEALRVSVGGAEKITLFLSDIAGNNKGIDLKIYLNGDMANPVMYEYAVGTVTGGKLTITLDAASFGSGLITAVDISSVANSSRGVETFFLDNVRADIPGGVDTNSLRIGFEDLTGTGDADYEDVLFDLDINPVTVGDLNGGDDTLDGGLGNDTIYGEGGDDILLIGLGADNAYGGAGADIFALTAIDAQVDTIHDFKIGEGDVINITEVLEGYDPLSDDIADFVRLVQNGGNAELQINADGDQAGAFTTAALILGGASLTVAGLVNEGALVANQNPLA